MGSAMVKAQEAYLTLPYLGMQEIVIKVSARNVSQLPEISHVLNER